MALNTLKCNHLTPLRLKGKKVEGQGRTIVSLEVVGVYVARGQFVCLV